MTNVTATYQQGMVLLNQPPTLGDEATLQLSYDGEPKFKAIDGDVTVNVNTGQVTAGGTNAAFDTLLGYGPGVLVGQSVLDLNLLEPVAMDEPHFVTALRYAALNPVRAKLVARAEDWPWSSAGKNGNADVLVGS